MRVKWIDGMSATHFENVQSMFPEDANPSDFDQDFKGEVISSHKNFWGTTYLVIMCDDGKVREVEMSKVQRDDDSSST